MSLWDWRCSPSLTGKWMAWSVDFLPLLQGATALPLQLSQGTLSINLFLPVATITVHRPSASSHTAGKWPKNSSGIHPNKKRKRPRVESQRHSGRWLEGVLASCPQAALLCCCLIYPSYTQNIHEGVGHLWWGFRVGCMVLNLESGTHLGGGACVVLSSRWST